MRKCKLGDLFQIKQGFAFKSANYVDNSQYAIVTLANISESNNFQYNLANMRYYEGEFPDSVILKSGDLILPMTEQVEGLFGNSAFVPKENNVTFVLNQRVGLVKPFLDSDRFYIHYLLALDSVRQQLEYRATGTRQRNISPDGIYDVNVEIHEPKERERIGEFLYRLEQKVNNNNNIIQLLESKGKEFYDYWFVQFDFPDANGSPYKTSGGKMEWNETLSREIPAEWDVIQLKDFAEVTQGNSPTGNTLNEENKGIAFYQGKTDFGMRFPIERIYTTEPYRYAEPMDTLLSVRAPVGAVNMAENKCCIGRGLAAIHQEKYPSLVYYMMMRLQPIFEKRGSGGTTFDSITKDDIKEVYICRPPKIYCECFEYKARAIDTQILNLSKENRKLVSLRDFLLPMLMNGQVTFRQ